jgi:hypothetical protein
MRNEMSLLSLLNSMRKYPRVFSIHLGEFWREREESWSRFVLWELTSMCLEIQRVYSTTYSFTGKAKAPYIWWLYILGFIDRVLKIEAIGSQALHLAGWDFWLYFLAKSGTMQCLPIFRLSHFSSLSSI